jgi:hypothetical protein
MVISAIKVIGLLGLSGLLRKDEEMTLRETILKILFYPFPELPIQKIAANRRWFLLVVLG